MIVMFVHQNAQSSRAGLLHPSEQKQKHVGRVQTRLRNSNFHNFVRRTQRQCGDTPRQPRWSAPLSAPRSADAQQRHALVLSKRIAASFAALLRLIHDTPSVQPEAFDARLSTKQ
jgi:hypothetical protein